MASITLEKIYEDLEDIKKDMAHIKLLIEEDFELSEETVRELEASRKRAKSEFIPHEDMRKEFS